MWFRFLSELFGKGFANQTAGVHRSAISAYHKPVNGTPVGQLSFISNLLVGVFNKSPPKPRSIFDMEKSLKYLQNLSPTANLSGKDLTLKLTIQAACRCSELKYIGTALLTKSLTNMF